MVAPDRRKKEVGTIAAQEPRLNEAIKVKECRLIAYDGSQLGIYPIEQAQRIADNEGYDLVEIAPQAQPPVCRIMDYGKFKYDQAIKAKQARKNQSKIETKEMKFRPKIDIGDYTTKKKHVMRFLAAGSKVRSLLCSAVVKCLTQNRDSAFLSAWLMILKTLRLLKTSQRWKAATCICLLLRYHRR